MKKYIDLAYHNAWDNNEEIKENVLFSQQVISSPKLSLFVDILATNYQDLKLLKLNGTTVHWV